MAFREGSLERRRHPRFLPSAELYVISAKSVGRVLNISQGGLAFSYVRFHDIPLSSERLDILYDGNQLLRNIPVQSLSEHQLENEFMTSPMDVRCCRVVFGSLADDQHREMATLITHHARQRTAAPAVYGMD